MLYLILGAFAGVVTNWIIEKSRWNRQFSNTFRSRVTILASVLTILILIAIAVYFLPHEMSGGDLDRALRTKHLAGLTINVLTGLGVGIFISYCIRTRNFNTAQLGILVILVVIGTGPNYWSYWLTSLGIKKIGQVEFSNNQLESKAIYLPPNDNEHSSSLVSIHQISLTFSSELEGMKDRDKEINELLGSQKIEDANNTNKIIYSLDWLVQFAKCIAASGDQNKFETTSVRSIVKPVAQGFYDILNFLPLGYDGPSIQKREVITKNFINRLDAAYSSLRKLPLIPLTQVSIDKNCSINKINSNIFAENLKILAMWKSDYPYAIIGLAYLFKVSELDIVERKFSKILDNWINRYHQSNDPNARTWTYLVRAYSYFDLLMAVDQQPGEHTQEWFKIKIKYLGTLQELLKHAAMEEYGLLNDDDPNCKTSKHENIKRIIVAEIFAKNAFADLAGKAVKNMDSIEYQRKALDYARENLRYTDTISAINCLDSERTRGIADYIRAVLLDTHASVNVSYAKYNHNTGKIGVNELIGIYKGAISTWNDALAAIDQYEATTENLPNKIRQHIIDLINEFRRYIIYQISVTASVL